MQTYNQTTDAAKIAAATAREKNEIRTRNGSLIFLAFGTAISSAMVGIELANHFQLNLIFKILGIIFLVVFAYISIDSNVRNNLLASSDKTESEGLKRYFQKKSIMALTSTVLFSICSAYFVGQISKGKSPHEKFNTTVEKFSKRDSTNKALAAATLSNLTQEQEKEIKTAKATAKTAEASIIQTFEGRKISESWRKDYHIGKYKTNSYIWTCSNCPKKYKRWRNEILKIRADRDNRAAEISKSNLMIKNNLATTLSYELQSDTSLATMKIYTNTMENERQNKSLLITFILVLLTIFAALGAYSSNNNLKKLREIHGQFILAGDQIIFDVFEDFLMTILRQFLGLIFGVLIIIDKALEKIGIDLYEIKNESIAKFTTNNQILTNYSNQSRRVVVNGFGLNNPDQLETLGHQGTPADQQRADQSRPMATTSLNTNNKSKFSPMVNLSGDQNRQPINQAPRPAPTNSDQLKTVIEKQTTIVINNTDLQRLKSDCKKYYLRSFFPSNDSQYKTRKNPPSLKTLADNKKRHLDKLEKLVNLGINVKYKGEGFNRVCYFL